MANARYREVALGNQQPAKFFQEPDGVLRVRPGEGLEDFPPRLLDRLVDGARDHPARPLVAKRDGQGHWREVSYAEMLDTARHVAQALLDRELSAERPILILSGNDIEHLELAFGAMLAGVPYCPVSPAASLLSRDYRKLQHYFQHLTPGLVFASDAEAYANAIRAVVPDDVELVFQRGDLPERPFTPFASLRTTRPGQAVDETYAATGPDTIAKFLFTSGSTKAPKAVITTQRMLCANQQMLRQTFPFLGEEPPVLLDWLPWNHTFGGSHNVGLALYNGGSLYIDDGKPTAPQFAETLHNLRDIAPTLYINVPKGWEELTTALEEDAALRERFFSRVKMFFFAGAGLAQPVWDRLDAIAEAHCGERIRMVTGLGMTETSPSCSFATHTEIQSGDVGLPCPGCEMKLVPVDGKLEARFRGPHVMPGYWRDPEQTRQAFDDEGFYASGDALKPVSTEDLQRGFRFDGRVAEDFKLSSGSFVSVGPLRARIVEAGALYVQDAVIAGIDRDHIGVLLFPRWDECRKLAGLEADAGANEVLSAPKVRAYFQALVGRLYRDATGSSNRVGRALVLADPPAIDKGEVTDKGSINQRAVLAQRADLVEALYAGTAPRLILPQADVQPEGSA